MKMRNWHEWAKAQNRAKLLASIRTRRERTEEKRWSKFLREREAFDEAIEAELDVYELMKRNQDGCGW
jgi:hypothetical protein